MKPPPDKPRRSDEAAEAARDRVERRPPAPDPVDEAAEESFPASDPPSFMPTHLGDPDNHPGDAR